MQFNFNVAEAFGIQGSGIALLTDQSLRGMHANRQQKINTVLDGMGRGSQAAQGLPTPITSMSYIRDSHHFLFLAVDEDRCQGILKGGIKHLFMLDSQSETHEMDAMCCLDFYTHESVQRRGIGTWLFRAMELYTHISAQGWAFDRPSSKLLAFLSKVYKMEGFKPQMNNFLMLDPAIRLWGVEFKQYRRSKKHYIPDPYLLAEVPEAEYIGSMDLSKKHLQKQQQQQQTSQEANATESPKITAQRDSPSSAVSLTADDLLTRRSVVLPPSVAKQPPLSDQPQSVAAAYMNKNIKSDRPSFEDYMKDHYGSRSSAMSVGASAPSRPPENSASKLTDQMDMIQRQRQLDKMAFELARTANTQSSIRSTGIATSIGAYK